MNNADDAFWTETAAQRHGMSDGGLSDQQVAREHRAQAIFFPALAFFQARVRDAAKLSMMMEDDFRLLLDALDDHAPTQERWDERISEKRS